MDSDRLSSHRWLRSSKMTQKTDRSNQFDDASRLFEITDRDSTIYNTVSPNRPNHQPSGLTYRSCLGVAEETV